VVLVVVLVEVREVARQAVLATHQALLHLKETMAEVPLINGPPLVVEVQAQ
jgi:hypothetical protein